MLATGAFSLLAANISFVSANKNGAIAFGRWLRVLTFPRLKVATVRFGDFHTNLVWNSFSKPTSVFERLFLAYISVKDRGKH